MVLRSIGNAFSNFEDYRARTAKGASDEAPTLVVASGGVKVTDGNDVYHVFLGGNGPDYAANSISEETFTITQGTISSAEILVVAGGGGAEPDGSGGGGAGAVYHAGNVPLPASSIPITIGERGGVPEGTSQDGGDTTFGPLTAQGGGAGKDASDGNPGGSGGGGGGPGSPSGGSSTASPVTAFGVTFTAYGNGGASNPVGNDGGSGGGGALNAGNARSGAAGGAGGAGRSFPAFPGPVISPALPTTARPNVDPNYGGTAWPTATTNPVALNSAWQTATGPTGLFGGGGGGGAYFPVTTRAEGGAGGGGSGASSGASNGPGPGYAFPGLDYTGGGGGAATSSSAESTGQPGGRGIVIIKYDQTDS
jgi:hypothetical protein